MKINWLLGSIMTVAVPILTVVLLIVSGFGFLEVLPLGILIALTIWFTWGFFTENSRLANAIAYTVVILAGALFLLIANKTGIFYPAYEGPLMLWTGFSGIIAAVLCFCILLIQSKLEAYGKSHAQFVFFVRFLYTFTACALYVYFVYYQPSQSGNFGLTEGFDWNMVWNDGILLTIFAVFTIRAFLGFFLTPRHYDLPYESDEYSCKCMQQILADAICITFGFAMAAAILYAILFLVFCFLFLLLLTLAEVARNCGIALLESIFGWFSH